VAGRESERAEFTPLLLLSDPHYSQWKTVPEEVLTIAGADRFARRDDTRRPHAIFMNQLCVTWGEQDELSSRAVFVRVPKTYIDSTIRGRMRGALLFRDVCNLKRPVH
jgi:hypothetical protein